MNRQPQPKYNPATDDLETLLWQAYEELENERLQVDDAEEKELVFDLDGIPQHSLFDGDYDD